MPSFVRIASILILGLAPGLRGANAQAAHSLVILLILYDALIKKGSSGICKQLQMMVLRLNNVRITNVDVPPQNKPNAAEITTCRPYLSTELAQMKELKTF